MTVDLKQYYTRYGKPFQELSKKGYRIVSVLHDLYGSEFNDVAYAWISSLRPSKLRVITEESTIDFVLWRVTVYFERFSNRIYLIEQEVEVSLPEDNTIPVLDINLRKECL